MIKLSAFADEIGKDLDLQIETLKKNGVGYIELRGVWGKNVLELTEQEVRTVASTAKRAGIGFSAIGSPLGKFPLDGDFSKQIEGTKRAIEYAQILEAPYIRVFSYYIPKGDDPATHRTQVIDWLAKLIEIAEESNIILAHENEAGIYGDSGARCLDLLSTLKSPAFTGVLDFSNFAVHGEQVYEQCWVPLEPYITYFHVKDYSKSLRKVVPAGAGDGDVKRILTDAYAKGYDNFLTLEPHLSVAEANYGVTSPELFATATTALKTILADIGALS
jgi:3-dehydroshikimate dehydratase